MALLRYCLNDLKHARRHVETGARHIARQEKAVDRLTIGGGTPELALGLLSRLQDRQRRQLDRVKWIEAMLGPRAAG